MRSATPSSPILSLNSTPIDQRLFAREAIRLIGANLRRAVKHGIELGAREGMMLGSLYAGIALANASANAVHALAYPLQGLKRVTHGVANSLLLPYVMEYNAAVAVEQVRGHCRSCWGGRVSSPQSRWRRQGWRRSVCCRRRWASRNI